MKKSNKWAVVLSVLVVTFYIGNMAYHKYNFNKNIHSFKPKDVFDTQRSRIKVVKIIDSKLRAANKIYILGKEEKGLINCAYRMQDKQQQDAFFKCLIYNSDTLFIQTDSLPIRFPTSNNSEIFVMLENVKTVIYNDKPL
jgi:hypothetical protein